jgi:two-component system, cell cycle sensor histidine kinase and response regulator CckA
MLTFSSLKCLVLLMLFTLAVPLAPLAALPRQPLKVVEEGFSRITPDERKIIEEKWYGSSLGDSIPVDSILVGIGVLCLLLLVLFVWNRMLKRAVEKRTAELKRTEDSLRLTSFAVEHAADSVYWITADASIIVANEAACRLLGYTRDELLKLKIADIDANYNAKVWQQHWEELKAHGSLFFETSQRAKDGRIIPVEITANFIRFNDCEYNCAFVRDIADRKRAEDAIREREERLRVIFEASNSGIILVTSQGIIDFANRRMAEMFGIQLHELLGTSYSEHLHESEKKVGDERMHMLIRGEIQSVANERRFIRKDGTDFWGHLSGRRLENPDGSLQALVGVISDITELKQMIRLLAESEVRLRTLVQTIPDMIWLKDVNGVYLFCNTKFERFFDARETEIVGKTDYDFVDNELADFFRKYDRKAMAAGKSSCNEEWITFADDGHRALLETIKTPMNDADGKLIGVLGIARDITDRKKSEEDRIDLERQLLHSQKLESLGILSGGIAHDFNNLLQAVLGNLDLALMRLPQETSARKNIDQAIKAALHAAKLTNMMLAYSGKGLFVIKPLNLTELVEENAAMLDATIPKSITLEQHLDHALPIIKADAGQLQQVIMNLITNASEAIGDASGTITLATGVGEIDQNVLNESRLDEKTAAGRYVWLEVRDNGCGMDEETLHKLFDPFFTTKFTGRGLGMSAVLGIIRAHKGAFLAKSVPGGGTTIKVLFPTADDQPAGSDPVSAGESVQEKQAGLSVKVLVVDDEDMIRAVSTAMLKELGFETLAAASGEEALALFREAGDSIGVVLLDQVMPGMDGVSVFKELRNIRPDIKVLLASGFSKQEVSERFRGLGLNGFLPKPYTLKNLTAELTRVMKKTDK